MEYSGAVLCGGYGTRLRPLTEEIPKPLIELKPNYTIMDKQLLHFKTAGISTVYFLAGYLHEKIHQRYKTSWNGIDIKYLIEDKPRGTLYAINNLFNNVNCDIILMNGDIVSDFNLKEMLNNYQKKEMLIFVTPLVSPFGVMEIVDSKVISFKEKPVLPSYINAGVYVIPTSLKDYFLKYKKGDAERLVFPSLARDGLLTCYKEDDVFWQSVDSVKDLEAVQSEYHNKTDKPWGYEKVIVSTEKYLTKELFIKKGETTSFHYHEQKDETLHVFKGQGYVEFEENQTILRKNDTVRIKPQTVHSIHAVENLILNEYSTPHPEDTVRTKDMYNRCGPQ